ncbi:MAG TPA: hypothetical protein VN493_02310 [Thermoanaerobaculia bacterium]|nr:hypothetical protein [Thermoanaerobaculia bacterium]
MSQETLEMVQGAVIVVFFVAFCIAAGKVIYSFKNARFTKAWTPLVPIINGTVAGDGGGGATSWLTGTWQGRKVQAAMVPNRNRYSGETGPRYNYFEIQFPDVPGSQDWKVLEGYRIETKDQNLAERLQASGILAMIERFGSVDVEYRARQGALTYSEDVTPLWVPFPERFEQELSLLQVLARVNGEVNSKS